MSNQYFTLDDKSIKHLANKIVEVVPGNTSELENDKKYATKEFLDQEIEKRGFSSVDKTYIDDNKITELDIWSSSKIGEFVLDNNDTTWIDVNGISPSAEGTKEGHMKEVEIFGNTWQDKDGIGNNKFSGWKDENVLNFTNGELFPFSNNHWASDYIEVSKKQYIFTKLNDCRYCLYDLNKKFISGKQSNIINIKEENVKYIRIGGICKKEGVRKDDIMLNEGSELLPYEPYHKADLSDIRHVGELQDDGRYKIEVESCNDNLINLYKNEIIVNKKNTTIINVDTIRYDAKVGNWNTTRAEIKVPCKPSTYYTATALFKEIPWKNKVNRVSIRAEGEIEYFLSPNSVRRWVQTGEKSTYFTFIIYGIHGTPEDKEYPQDNVKFDVKLALKEGRVETIPSKQYSKQTLLLPCQLSKVGDVQDRLYWNGKKYVVEKNVNEYHIGSEGSLNSYKIIPEFSVIGFYNTLSHNKWKTNIYDEYTNFTKEKQSFPGRVVKDIISFTTLDNMIKFAILKSNLETQDIDGLKKYLQSNPLIIYRVLKEPKLIETDITEQIFPSTFKDKTHFFVKGGLDGEIKGKVPVDAGKAILSLTKQKNELLAEKNKLDELNNQQNELLDLVNLASQEMVSIVELATTRDTLD